MRLSKFFFIATMLFPMMCLANGVCEPILNLGAHFNFMDYQKCYQVLHSCPVSHAPFLDQKCIEEVIQSNKFCRQLNTLSNFLQTDPEFVTLNGDEGKISIVKVYYPADGGERYHLLTHQNCLINTDRDPRSLSKELKKRYQQLDIYTQNKKEPKKQIHADGSFCIRAPIVTSHLGRSGDILLEADIHYHFSKDGQLTKVAIKNIKLH